LYAAEVTIGATFTVRVAAVEVCQIDGTTERRLQGNKAYSGWFTSSANSLTIESLNSQYILSVKVIFE